MDNVRAQAEVVSLPLTKDPPLLWNMNLKDLIWPVSAVLLDLLIWRHHERVGIFQAVAMSMIFALGMILAVARIQYRSIPQWLVIIFGFYVRPKLYLP